MESIQLKGIQMKKNQMKTICSKSFLLIALLLASVSSNGAGFEKAVLWGAKYSGVAGVAAPGIKGSDSIYYNPAGLVNSSEFGEFVFNLSQSSSTVKGPVVPSSNVLLAGPTVSSFTYAEKKETSNNGASIIPGVTYSMKLTDSLSLGLGYYAVGGVKANYEDVDFAPRSFKAKVSSDVVITEFAAGLGYKVSDSFRLGAALRYTMTNASFNSMGYTTSASGVAAITALEVKDIKAAQLDSVRLGAQYDLSESVKLGFTLRTETKLNGTGKASGKANACGAAVVSGVTNPCAAVVDLNIAEVDAKVETSLPMALGLSTEIKLSEAWKFFGEYVFTQYSKIEKVVVDGTITVGSTSAEITDIDLKWKDQHNLKLAGEYTGISWPVRFGYVWTSQVSNTEYARASFTPPGAASTYTLGTGHEFQAGSQPMEFNLAVDYTTVSGSASDTPENSLNSPKGSYDATALGIHTGLSYKF